MDDTTVTAQPEEMQQVPSPQSTQMIPMQQTPPAPTASGAISQDVMNGGTQGFIPQSPSDIENHAAAVHHSRLANMLNAVGDILGGNKTLRMVKNADGSVDLQQVDSSSGEKWGRVAQAALRGASTGFAVGQGPGGAQRAAAASVAQGMAQPQEQQDKTLAQANQMNDQNQKKQLFAANMAHMNQQLVKGAFDMQQAKVQAGEHEEDRALMVQKSMDQMGGKMSVHVGADGDENKMMEDISQAYNGDPELKQAHHDGRTAVFRTVDPKTGLVNGADIYIIPEDQMDKRNEADFVRKRLILDPQHPDKAPIWSEMGTIKKGAMSYRDQMAMMQNDDIYNNQILTQYETRTGALAQAKIAAENAKAQRAMAAGANAEKFHEGEVTLPDGTKTTMAIGDRGTMKPYEGLAPGATVAKPGSGTVSPSVKLALDRQYGKPANDLEASWDVVDKTYQEYEALRKQGKQFPTGAQAKLLLSQHMQSTFGQVKGGRLTKSMIEEHVGAVGITDKVVKAFQAAYNGDDLTPAQWTAFHQLIGEQRHAKWQEYSDAATTAGADPKAGLPEALGGYPKPKIGPVAAGPQTPPGAAIAGQAGNPSLPAAPKVTIPPIPQGHTPQVNYVKGSDGKFYWIEPGQMEGARQTDKNLQVIPR